MEKLSKETRETLKVEYKLDNSKQNIDRLVNKYGITRRRLFQIVKEDLQEETKNSIQANGDNFTKRVNKIIDLVLDRIEKQVQEDDKATLSQLSTTLGILYDKSRLENNLSTSNNSINIKIKVEK